MVTFKFKVKVKGWGRFSSLSNRRKSRQFALRVRVTRELIEKLFARVLSSISFEFPLCFVENKNESEFEFRKRFVLAKEPNSFSTGAADDSCTSGLVVSGELLLLPVLLH